MFCGNCGKENLESMNFCMYCGKPLDKDDAVPLYQPNHNTSAQPSG